MAKTKLKYLFAALWLLNMVFQFGNLSNYFQNSEGVFDKTGLTILVFLLVLFLYLFNDVLKFNRPIFLRIVAIIFILSSLNYLFLAIYFKTLFYVLLFIPTLSSGLVILKKVED